MNCKRIFSLVNILVFSFQYYPQWNHFTWEMIPSFIFSDWLMSLGCCQIRICYPMFLTTGRATGSKVCWGEEGEPIPAERSGSTIMGWMENQELNVRFWKTDLKKVPTCLKVPTNQKQCCGTALIIFVPATYAIYHNHFLFLFMATG